MSPQNKKTNSTASTSATMSAAPVRSEAKRLTALAMSLFSEGDIEGAFRSWRGALGQLIPRMVVAADAKGSDSAAAVSRDERVPGTFSVQPFTDGEATPLGSLEALTLDDRSFSVYATAFHYQYSPAHPAEADNESGQRTVRSDDLAFAATVLYNMGLCSHLLSLLRRGPGLANPSACQDMALRSYGAAQGLLAEALAASAHRPVAVDPQTPGIRLLGLALVNNRACIFERRYDNDGACRELRELLALLTPYRGEGAEREALLPFLLTAALHHGCRRNRVCIHAPSA
jgi:hypothetical protein